MIKNMGKFVKAFLIENECMRVDISTAYIGGENSAFVKGTGNTILVGISSKSANRATLINSAGGYYGTSTTSQSKALEEIEAAIKCINDNKKDFIEKANDEFSDYNVTNVKVQEGRLRVINVAVSIEEKK